MGGSYIDSYNFAPEPGAPGTDLAGTFVDKAAGGQRLHSRVEVAVESILAVWSLGVCAVLAAYLESQGDYCL